MRDLQGEIAKKITKLLKKTTMTTFNKDLSPIDQARLVLRNYDKVVAERDGLKKEVERLNKVIEQKDVLYRNMLERMETKNKASGIEDEYRRMKKQYDELNEKCKQLEGARYSVEIIKQLCGIMRAYGKQLRKAGLSIDDIEAMLGGKSEEESKGRVVMYDSQTRNFIAYVRKIVDIFRKTGTLRGISVFAAQAGVTSITKEKFFLYGLDKEGELTDEEIVELYENVKKR